VSLPSSLLVVLSVIDSAGIEKPILVPLTSSLYVPGSLADTENVIVDVGTGFYVEKVGGDIETGMFLSDKGYDRAQETLLGFMRIRWRS
jgi:prefoldin alpha subunit